MKKCGEITSQILERAGLFSAWKDQKFRHEREFLKTNIFLLWLVKTDQISDLSPTSFSHKYFTTLLFWIFWCSLTPVMPSGYSGRPWLLAVSFNFSAELYIINLLSAHLFVSLWDTWGMKLWEKQNKVHSFHCGKKQQINSKLKMPFFCTL